MKCLPICWLGRGIQVVESCYWRLAVPPSYICSLFIVRPRSQQHHYQINIPTISQCIIHFKLQPPHSFDDVLVVFLLCELENGPHKYYEIAGVLDLPFCRECSVPAIWHAIVGIVDGFSVVLCRYIVWWQFMLFVIRSSV